MYFELSRVTSDKQGRLSLPVSLFKTGDVRRGGTVCIYPIENYWLLCDVKRFQEILETEHPGSAVDPDVRSMRRSFMIHVKSLHIDPQGRIQFKNIDPSNSGSEYVVVGVGLEFEIWPSKVWQGNNEEAGGNNEQV